MTDSDENLVGRAQRGERAAFEELLRRTSRLVFARLYLETGDTHQTEDLLQETYLLAFKSLASLTDPKAFRAWLLSMAHNVSIDAARRSLRKKRTSGPQEGHDALAGVAGATPDPGEQVAQKELRGQVLALLRGLPEEYRLPLTLRYIADADYDSIRTQLGLTNGSLRGLLHRGLKLLRERLPPELGEAAQYPRALQQD
ncbi:MAG TPA: RNA polymerase sigma factor [Gemmataceae bacterium]|jgi:RNA polymerase sigma-70 factor (ECF subfamily)|nr:RNA polymerase sigma factor [Gemmataceae bacterium]